MLKRISGFNQRRLVNIRHSEVTRVTDGAIYLMEPTCPQVISSRS